MSIFDIFKPETSQAPVPATPIVPTVAPAPQGGIPAVPPVTADLNNPTVPVVDLNNSTAVPTGEIKDDSPLAQFKDLWDNPKVDEDKNQPTNPVLKAEDVQKIVAKADFSKSITPESLVAIAAGGEEAQAALPGILNAVAQAVMVQSTMVNNKLTEQAVERAIKAHTASLPDLLRSQNASDHLKTTNPLFNNPAVTPVIEATKQQLLKQYPNATPTEITEMTQSYIVAMGEAFAPKTAVNDGGTGETDWAAFMES